MGKLAKLLNGEPNSATATPRVPPLNAGVPLRGVEAPTYSIKAGIVITVTDGTPEGQRYAIEQNADTLVRLVRNYGEFVKAMEAFNRRLLRLEGPVGQAQEPARRPSSRPRVRTRGPRGPAIRSPGGRPHS